MKVKSLIATSVLAASAMASSVAMAESEFTGNIGFTNNYIWRGVTQSDDLAAISGGIDYGYKGFYAGTWLSSLGGSQYEQDLYAGYGFDLGPTSWDVGYIAYTYPITDVELDFAEVYLNFGWQWLSAGVAYTVSYEADVANENDIYAYVAGEWELASGMALGALYGNYDYDEPTAEDYAHYQLYLTKNDFKFAVDQNDKTNTGAGEDDMRFTVSYSKSFDLLK